MESEKPILHLKSPSGRIILTNPSPAEDEIVSVFRTSPIVRRYLQFLPATLSVEDARKRREDRGKDPQILDLAVFLQAEDGTLEFAGSTAIFHIDDTQKSCEAGILVVPKFHGQGLTAEIFCTLLTYVFEERGFHRVSFETSMENAPMRGWLEKAAGVRLEGVKKECWTDSAGGWVDVASYAVLSWEWRDNVKARLEKRIHSLSQIKGGAAERI